MFFRLFFHRFFPPLHKTLTVRITYALISYSDVHRERERYEDEKKRKTKGMSFRSRRSTEAFSFSLPPFVPFHPGFPSEFTSRFPLSVSAWVCVARARCEKKKGRQWRCTKGRRNRASAMPFFSSQSLRFVCCAHEQRSLNAAYACMHALLTA